MFYNLGAAWSLELKKTKISHQYNQVPHLTRNTILESDKGSRKHHTQESQEVNPFPADDHKTARTDKTV